MVSRIAIDTMIAPLFVPATRLDRLTKAAASGADAIIIDLKDAVAQNNKVAARDAIRAVELPLLPVVLRVNGRETPWYDEDILLAATKKFAAVMLPKCEDPAAISAMVGASIAVIALVETAHGLANLTEIAKAPSVCRIAFGSVDFAADMGCAHEPDSLLFTRAQIVLASRLAGLAAPIDGVTIDIDNEPGIEADARRAVSLGFAGKLCIHPRQIAPVIRGFAPASAETEWAERVFSSTREGAFSVDGVMINPPVRRRAEQILKRVEVLKSLKSESGALMYQILKGMRVVEGASFIAGPICCQHLLQLGAEVIRFDMIGGGPDFKRWPLAPSGLSLYWEGLNKGKKSIAIDLSSREGRDLAVRIATAPGEDAGLFVSNYPATDFLAHERLAALRSDMITVRVMGWADGRSGVDYTVNAVSGLPLMTGPDDLPEDRPVNHVLPAWDLITGSYAAFALLAAERRRRLTGRGDEVRVPLSDIAATSLGHIGQIAEVCVSGRDRPRIGNDLYGALGRDYETADGKRLIIAAITGKQWTTLLRALEIKELVAGIEGELGVSFADEGVRFDHRARLFCVIQDKVSRFTLSDLSVRLDNAGCCWNAYQKLSESIVGEVGFVQANPVFAEKRHSAGYAYPTPGSAATFTGLSRLEPSTSPRLGEHTDQILAEVLGLSASDIGRLHDRGVVAGPDAREG